MSDPSFLPGQTLEAGRLRSVAPWTLLFSGSKSIPTGAAIDTVVDTLANVVTNDEIPWSVSSGVITLPEGGLFLVSLHGSFATNGAGAVRRVHLRGSSLGIGRLAPYSFPSAGTGGTGLAVSGAIPLEIEPGETLDVLARQDAGAALTVNVSLGLTRLATNP
jgi:hypothetical protein